MQNNFALLCSQHVLFGLLLCGDKVDEAAAKARSVKLAYSEAAGPEHPLVTERWAQLERTVWSLAADAGALQQVLKDWLTELHP